MRASTLALPLLPLLTGCYVDRDDSGDRVTFYDNGSVSVVDQSPNRSIGWGRKPEKGSQAITASTSATKGRILDLANVLDVSAEQNLATQIDAVRQQRGRRLFVVTVPLAKTDSLEQFGWAVRSPSPDTHSMLLDPVARRVRIEGPQSPEAKAMIVRAMQPALDGGRIEQALRIGISRLGA